MCALPLLGNLLDARHDFLTFLLWLRHECGSIGTFRVESRTILFLNSPELVHAVLVEQAYDFEKTPIMRTNMRPMVGNGLLTSENEFRKRQRKLAAPAFQHRPIAAYELRARQRIEPELLVTLRPRQGIKVIVRRV